MLYRVLRALNSGRGRGSSSGAPTARTRRGRVPALVMSTVRTLMRQNYRRSSPCRAEQLFLPSLSRASGMLGTSAGLTRRPTPSSSPARFARVAARHRALDRRPKPELSGCEFRISRPPKSVAAAPRRRERGCPRTFRGPRPQTHGREQPPEAARGPSSLGAGSHHAERK